MELQTVVDFVLFRNEIMHIADDLIGLTLFLANNHPDHKQSNPKAKPDPLALLIELYLVGLQHEIHQIYHLKEQINGLAEFPKDAHQVQVDFLSYLLSDYFLVEEKILQVVHF
jgi:hypothetical protein